MSNKLGFSSGNRVQNDATRGSRNENDKEHGRRWGSSMNEDGTASRFIGRPVNSCDHTVYDD